jgi:hypothetical protein
MNLLNIQIIRLHAKRPLNQKDDPSKILSALGKP